ncbi:MAG: hypothetical protein AUK48_08590 [Oscillatoriales cyanobacterium CG2_30_44_21]|nr:MAG: hypothetical protein AUK48_08590 [Oscillatoriales cyanobacterium CG2_30_44_21]
MKLRTSKRPIAITILCVAMIGVSMVMVSDRLLNFYLYRLLDSSSLAPSTLADGNQINLQVVSGIAFLGLGTVPILLAIGLWQLKSWARFLSICMFSAIMFPAIAACLGWVSPPSAENLLQIPMVFDDVLNVGNNESLSRLMLLNPYIAIGNAIALLVLLVPSIGKTFRQIHWN